jgi:hypothetical protein
LLSTINVINQKYQILVFFVFEADMLSYAINRTSSEGKLVFFEYQ